MLHRQHGVRPHIQGIRRFTGVLRRIDLRSFDGFRQSGHARGRRNMALQRLERAYWTSLCELLTAELLGKWAEIRIASYDLGVQLETRFLPVMGVTYDAHDD